VIATLVASILILYPIWTRVFSISLPINETRSRSSLGIVTEYFVDQERYFYLIFLHANVAFMIGGGAMLAIGAMFIVCLQHACGMFRITR